MEKELLEEVYVSVLLSGVSLLIFTDQKDLPLDLVIIRKNLLNDSITSKDEMDKVKQHLRSLLRQKISSPSEVRIGC